MNTRTTAILILLMIVAATIVGVALWNRLPDTMASHWDASDQVNGYMSKFWGVFLMPLVALGVGLLFLAVPNIDPLRANIAQFRAAFNLLGAFVIAFLLYIYLLSLRWNLGDTSFRMSQAILPALGILFFFLGFLMRKTKRNFFIGIRTPWTLSSDHVWEETHRLGSILFMISGGMVFLGSFFGEATALWFLFVPLIGSTIVTLFYSYVLYQREVHV